MDLILPPPPSGLDSILILCTHNAVRSPILEIMMKEAYGAALSVHAAGVEAANIVDPLAQEVMREVGLSLDNYHTRSYHELPERSYNLIIALSRPAYDLALEIACQQRLDVEYWVTSRPPVLGDLARAHMLDSMRQIRSELKLHLENRFAPRENI